jgi:hypothetical protein
MDITHENQAIICQIILSTSKRKEYLKCDCGRIQPDWQRCPGCLFEKMMGLKLLPLSIGKAVAQAKQGEGRQVISRRTLT